MATPPRALQTYGHGSPIVLIPGFGLDPAIWEEIVPELATQHQVIVVGLPGLGKTPFVPTGSMEGLAQWLHHTLTPLQLPPFVLAGHSMGGYLALAYLDKYPDTLKGLQLVHSHAYADTAARIKERKKVADFVLANGVKAWASIAIPPLFTPSYAAAHPAEIEKWTTRYSAFEPQVIAHYLDAMAIRPDRTQVLAKSPVPIGLIIGEEDQHVPFDLSFSHSSLTPVIDTCVLRNAAHMGMLEQPTTVSSTISEFSAHCDYLQEHP